MKIISINKCCLKIQPIKTQNTFCTPLRPIKNDSFEKTCSLVPSFSSLNSAMSSFDEKYIPYSKEMTDYIMNSETLEQEKIQGIISKYSPTTILAKDKNLRQYEGFCSKNVKGTTSEDGSAQFELLPMEINLPSVSDYQVDREKRVKYLDMLLHESSHVFQEESSDRTSLTDVYNKYLADSSRNINTTISTVQAANTLFQQIELNMAQVLYSKQKIEFPPKEISRSRVDIDKIFFSKFRMSTETYCTNLLNRVFAANKGKLDEDLLLDFFEYKTNCEKEAYQNALNSDKQLLGLQSSTDFDIRIQMYDKIHNAVQAMKKQ